MRGFRVEPEEVEAVIATHAGVAAAAVKAWLDGAGAVAIFNLMEDVATSEISRAQVWQWLHHGHFTREDVSRITDEEVAKLGDGYQTAREIFDRVAGGEEFVDFLTVPAYELLA